MATLAAELARLQWITNQVSAAGERIEVALEIAESFWLPEVMSQALNTKAGILDSKGRLEEGLALLRHALQIAEENDLPSAALRAYYNLSYEFDLRDRYEESEADSKRGLELARTVGHRIWERRFADQVTEALFAMGRWEELVALTDELAAEPSALDSWPVFVAQVHLNRDEIEDRELRAF